MNIQKVLTTAVLGVGLGALTLPGIALANVGAHPSVAPVGTTITLTARCKPQSKGPTPSATFHIKGPQRNQDDDRDHDRDRDDDRRDRDSDRPWEHDSGQQGDRAAGPGTHWDRDSDQARDQDSDRYGDRDDRNRDDDRSRDDDRKRDDDRDRDHDEPRDVSVQSTGLEPKMPDTVSAQVQTQGWKPGEYRVSAKCNDGTVAGETTFTLTPEGGPRGGAGGQSGDSALVAAGTAMLGAGAVGFVLLRRRRTGDAIG